MSRGFYKKDEIFRKYFPIILCWTCQVLLGLFLIFRVFWCSFVPVHFETLRNCSQHSQMTVYVLWVLAICWALERTCPPLTLENLSRIYKIFYNARAQEKRRKHKFYIYIWKCFMSTVKFYKIFAKNPSIQAAALHSKNFGKLALVPVPQFGKKFQQKISYA